MKKLILLALVALVAGAAFAETAPAFSGSFDLSTTIDFETDTYKIAGEDDATINLNGVVSEWASVNAELGVNEEDLVDGFNPAIELNQFTLTTDITGALGVDGPVGVSLKWGLVSHEAAEYNGVAGYDDVEPTDETGSYFGFVATITIMEKVKLIALVPPSTYTDYAVVVDIPQVATDPVISLELQFLGLIEGLDFNFWYTDDPNEAISNLGVTFGYDMAPLAIGGGFKSDMEADTFGALLSVAYDLGDMLTAGVAFGAADFGDFAASSEVGINVTFHAVPDMLDLYGAVKIPFENIGDNFGIDAGVQFFLAGVTYSLGYDLNDTGFQSPNDQGLYFRVQAKF
jgi:hypothetical protein